MSISSSTLSTTQARPMGMVVQLGSEATKIQLFTQWLDGAIVHFNRPINKTGNITTHATKAMQAAMRRIQKEFERGHVANISIPVSIVVPSEIGKVLPDGQSVEIPEGAKTMFGAKSGQIAKIQKWMNQQAQHIAPSLQFHVRAETAKYPQAQSLEAIVSANKNSLELNPGDTVHQYILDGKLTGRAASLGENGSLTDNSCKGDLSMQKIDNLVPKAFDRIPLKSSFEWRNIDQERTIGFRANDCSLPAILDNICNGNYQEAYWDSKSIELDSLNDVLRNYGILPNLINKDITDSAVILPMILDFPNRGVSARTRTSEEIIQAAKDGDRLATGILQFAIINSGKVIAKAITLQGKEGDLKPVSLLNLGGSFITDLRDAVDPDGSLLFKAINKELERLGHPSINDPRRRIIVADPSPVTNPLADAKTRLQAMFQNPQAV